MKDLVEVIAKALVDNPDEVVVTEKEDGKNITVELHVAADDMGKVIGKQGRIAKAIRSIFDGSIENALCIVMAVIEIILGVFLLLRLFINLGTSLDSVLMLIVMIIWVVFMVLVDALGNNGVLGVIKHGKDVLDFLYTFASHLIILGAIIKVRG